MAYFHVHLVFSLLSVCISVKTIPTVLIISLDGFRYDYLRVIRKFEFQTPNFDRLVDEGVTIKDPGLENAFITKTLPNHYSLVTGLYEESHGIVANNFFDPVFNETFTAASSMNLKWWNGTDGQKVEPIWVTNEAVDEKRLSGAYLWPGSDVPGQTPRYFASYFKNSSDPFRVRIDYIIDWFTRSTDPICFGALYLNEPDSSGHEYGPESREVAEKIVEIDADIGYLLRRLESVKLLDKMNIVLTSDHGMHYVSNASTIFLEDYVDINLFRSFAGSPVTHILPLSGSEEVVHNKLLSIPKLTVYKKDEIPVEYHYKNNRRITPIVIIAPLGFRICRTRSACKIYPGQHGWDNKIAAMHPIFIARGPAFKKNYVADPFKTVDIYALLCHLLDIDPRPNNGSLDAVRDILCFPSCSASCRVTTYFGSSLWLTVVLTVMQLLRENAQL